MTEKIIVIVEPQSSGCAFVTEALKMGHKVFVVTAHTAERQLPLIVTDSAAIRVIADTLSSSDVVRVLSEQGIVPSVVIPGFEYYVPVCAEVSGYFSIEAISIETANACRNKSIMRKILKLSGLDIPEFVHIQPSSSPSSFEWTGAFPVVVKPVNMSGSMHVSKEYSVGDINQAVARIVGSNDEDLDLKISKDVLVEEYIDGPEFSIDGIVCPISGQLGVWSYTRKLLGGSSGFVEIGHIVGMNLSDKVKTKIDNYLENVVKALGISRGPIHAELRWCRRRNSPVLIEIGARLGGDKIPTLIEQATGVSFVEAALMTLLGVQAPEPAMPLRIAAIAFRFDTGPEALGDFRSRNAESFFSASSLTEIEAQLKTWFNGVSFVIPEV